MKRFGVGLALMLVIASCGGSDAGGDGDTDGAAVSSYAYDACELADQAILDSYFTDSVVPERSKHGPVEGCTWADTNANSLLIQVSSLDLSQLSNCDECVDIDTGDGGFAYGGGIQSSAEFLVGDVKISVTTTGFGDTTESMIDLSEAVYTVATSQ